MTSSPRQARFPAALVLALVAPIWPALSAAGLWPRESGRAAGAEHPAAAVPGAAKRLAAPSSVGAHAAPSAEAQLERYALYALLVPVLDGPLLTGAAELEVQRDGEGFSARVHLQGLRAERDGRSVVLNRSFIARMP